MQVGKGRINVLTGACLYYSGRLGAENGPKCLLNWHRESGDVGPPTLDAESVGYHFLAPEGASFGCLRRPNLGDCQCHLLP